MPRFRLHLFGTATAANEAGATIAIPHRHRVALLALLAASPARSLSRDKLTALLWPEQPPANARRLLSVAVHGIRKTFDEQVLLTVGDDLVFSNDSMWVDAIQFEAALAEHRFADACAIYTAPFLDGFFLNGALEFERWQDAARGRFAEFFREALAALALEATNRGTYSDAVKWLRRLANEDPFHTGNIIALMQAMERAGDSPNAMLVAQAHEVLLRRELQMEPSPAFRRVVSRFRSGPAKDTTAGSSREEQRDAVAPAASSARALETTTVLAPRASASAHWGARRWLLTGAVVAVAGAAAYRLTPSLDERRIYVAPFLGADSSLASQALAAENAVTRVLARVDSVEVIHQPGGGASPRQWSRRLRAGTRVEGVVSQDGDSLWLEARIVASGSSRVVRSVRVSIDPLHAGLDEVAGRVEGALAMVLDERLSSTATEEHREPTAAALAAFRLGIDFFTRAEYARAAESFETASRDSQFTLARVWLAFTWYHGAQFARAFDLARAMDSTSAILPASDRFAFEWLRARSRGDVPGAYRAARDAARLAPASPWAFAQAEEALALRRPREAVQILRRFDGERGWVRGWSRYRNVLGSALHLLGDFESELELVRSSRRVGTNIWASMIDETRPLAAQGRWREVELRIDEALALPDQPTMTPGSIMRRAADELRAHGFEAQAKLAYLRTQRFYAPLALDSTAPLSVPSALGRALYAAGAFDSARTVFTRAYRRLPTMYALQANLGFVAAALGEREEARRVDSMLAVPDSSWNAFDAALRVFHRAQIAALLGERERALALLQRAAAMGVPVPLDSVHIAREFLSLRGHAAFDDLTRLR
jgi:DNA-binding SARP family transcriptional activator